MMDRRTWQLLMIGLGTALVPLDSAVNIAFPAITQGFGLAIQDIQWVVICYLLTYISLLLAMGRIGDLFGHALVFRVGLVWSAAALLLSAVAPSYPALLACRVLQGVGAALVLSCGPALSTSLFAEERRSRVLGVYTMGWALGMALGPWLGGALVQAWGWPAVFWFRVPVGSPSSVIDLRQRHGVVAQTPSCLGQGVAGPGRPSRGHRCQGPRLARPSVAASPSERRR